MVDMIHQHSEDWQQNFLIDAKTGTAFAPHNEQALMVTVDGVAQNLDTLSNGNQITFYEAILGKEENVDGEIVDVPAQEYYIRGFQLRDDSDNNQYLKPKDIKNNFDGRTRILICSMRMVLLSKQRPILSVVSQVFSRFQEIADSTLRRKLIKLYSKAPKNWQDLYEGVPDQLQNEEYFFGYSVGL